MTTKTKIILIMSAVLVVGGMLFWIHRQNSEINALKAKNSSLIGQKELSDGTTRAMSSYATKKDIESIIKESGIDLNTVKKDIKELDSDLKGVQLIISSSKGFKGTDIKSTKSIPGKDIDGTPIEAPVVQCKDGTNISCPDKFGYLTNRQNIELKEPFSDKDAPLGVVGFSSWKSNPWDVEIYPREYVVTTVLSTNKNGKTNAHSQMVIKSNGKSVEIPISQNNLIETLPNAKFMFNPRLYFGVDFGLGVYNVKGSAAYSIGEVIPGVQVFFFSHGKTKLDINWALLGLGAGYASQNNTLGFLLTPVQYNIGKPIPLIENLFLGPTISLDIKGNLGILLGLKIGL